MRAYEKQIITVLLSIPLNKLPWIIERSERCFRKGDVQPQKTAFGQRFWHLELSLRNQGLIFLWIWLSHLTQILSPESSSDTPEGCPPHPVWNRVNGSAIPDWDNNHQCVHFGKTKYLEKSQFLKLKMSFSSDKVIFNGKKI